MRVASLRVKISQACIAVLQPWRDGATLTAGVLLKAMVSWVTMMTDPSLKGWSVTMTGSVVNDV